jgi:hypothetical protein
MLPNGCWVIARFGGWVNSFPSRHLVIFTYFEQLSAMLLEVFY